MEDVNFYPVFVADQVLGADHLNELVNYLDEQQRLTRNKLIGIGIVCGLEIKVGASKIEISRGCGITSEGYLIVEDADLALTHYKEYLLPADFYPPYKPVYDSWTMWELVTDEEEEPLTPSFLRNKIVVLLLEMKEIPLKNCIDTDCDDKGNKIEFTVRRLLVNREDIDEFIASTSGEKPVKLSAGEIQLKRYGVPATPFDGSDDVLSGFLKLVDDATLQRVSEVLNFSYENYKHLLTGEPENPFLDVLTKLRSTLNDLKTTNPYFIQYYYDWIDDIIKGYYEFKDRAWYAQVVCCPGEDLFPLHLMLGEATRNTTIDRKSRYRHYFIYSPLFNSQKDILAEIQFLFRRLKLMIDNFEVRNVKEFRKATVRLTPSKYLDKTLSQRSIPYYYNPEVLHQWWNWDKSKKGNAKYNLSYNADLYSNSDAVINPLLYDIERFTFFRVEGHIGKNYQSALKEIIEKRDSFNLPFDVVAVSTLVLDEKDVDSSSCAFQDLQAMYEVLVAELMCKIGGPVRFVGDLDVEKVPGKIEGTLVFKYGSLKAVASTAGTKTKAATAKSAAAAKTAASEKSPEEEKISATTATTGEVYAKLVKQNYLLTSLSKRTVYQPGEIFSGNTLNADKLGTIYTRNWIKNNPSGAIKLIGKQSSDLLIFINAAENLFKALPPLLSDFDLATFLKYYKEFIEQLPDITSSLLQLYRASATRREDPNFTEDYANYFTQFKNIEALCFDVQFAALAKEFDERVAKIKVAKNFAAHIKSHPGYEHKAGVPKGGTLWLVYHEEDTRTGVGRNIGLTGERATLKEGGLSAAVKENEVAAKNAAASEKISPERSSASSKTNVEFIRRLKDEFLLSDSKIANIINIIGPAAPGAAPIFDLDPQTVIADFYVPYSCCSDCPPVAYVFPEQPGTVVFDIQPRTFLFDDAHNYPFTADPKVTDANREQIPFVSDELANPGNLKLWADANNILYLHPAMSDLPETLITPVTYKNKSLQLTIIKPDATFTINTDRDATGRVMVTLAAKNKNATSYEWRVNGVEDLFEDVADPPAVGLIELRDKLGTNEFAIELTIIYVINEVTSTDSKQQRLLTSVIVDFEPPLLAGTEYGTPANQPPGTVIFTSVNGVAVRIHEFILSNGNTSFNFARIEPAPGRFGSGQSIDINNVNLEFDFTSIGFKPSRVIFQFIDMGGSENFAVNGSQVFRGELSQVPPVIGGVNVSVVMSGRIGLVTLTGAINTLKVGGQEFGLDNVIAEL